MNMDKIQKRHVPYFLGGGASITNKSPAACYLVAKSFEHCLAAKIYLIRSSSADLPQIFHGAEKTSHFVHSWPHQVSENPELGQVGGTCSVGIKL